MAKAKARAAKVAAKRAAKKAKKRAARNPAGFVKGNINPKTGGVKGAKSADYRPAMPPKKKPGRLKKQDITLANIETK